MTEYYTMESVRSQIVGKYDVKSSNEYSVPIPSWNRYPCPVVNRCEKIGQTKCIGYVSIYVNTEKVKWLFLEICFFRNKQRAFILVNETQMHKLFELGVIADETVLIKESF